MSFERFERFEHDVLIVGAGPAGTSTALRLVRGEGVRADRVLVIDKARFPRDKPCAGAISQLGVDALGEVGVVVRVPTVAMQGVRVIVDDVAGETACAMGIVVRRIEFDAQLVDETRAAGVEIREGVGLRAIDRVNGGFRLTTTSGTSTARFVVAADGAGSTTRRLLGLGEAERKGHLYVAETPQGEADTGTARGLIDFDLSVLDDGLQGYYWDFPIMLGGQRGVSRGIYHANFTPSRDVKKALARALLRRGVDIAQVRLKPFATRPYVHGSQIAVPGLVLVGEAAGIDHTTGEGIAQAIVMGKIAARHLMRALRTGGVSFEAYAREVRASTIGRHMLQSAWLARRVYGRFGGPARHLLLRSTFARDAAMRWYHGESLPWSTQLRLALGLASRALA